MAKKIYRSRVDWWVWVTILLAVGVAVNIALISVWWVYIPFGGLMAFCLLLIVGSWYEIDGDQLVVYFCLCANRFPIDKIAEVWKNTGYLATAGMSLRRVSIRFNDRSVLKSSLPLEISPKDRDGFIAELKAINPNIIVRDNQ